MGKILKTVGPTLIVGAVISVFVATILIIKEQNEITSILIALSIFIVSLLVSVLLKIYDAENKILSNGVIQKDLMGDSFLLPIVQQIIESYKSMDQLPNEKSFFEDSAQRTLLACRDDMLKLSEGRMTIEADKTRIIFGSPANESVNLVSSHNDDFWKSRHAKNVMRVNRSSIERGIKFRHVWICDTQTLWEYKDLLYSLEAIGIHVKVAVREEVPADLVESYRIIDNIKLVRLHFAPDGRCKNYEVIVNSAEVNRAAYRFDLLIELSHDLNIFFPD